MVADPCLGVVFQHVLGYGAERGLPGRPVPAAETHKEIRRVLQVAAAKDHLGKIDFVDHVLTIRWIDQRLQATRDAIQDELLIGHRHDAALLAAVQVHVHSVQPHGIRLAVAPIHVGEQFGVARIGRRIGPTLAPSTAARSRTTTPAARPRIRRPPCASHRTASAARS